jgi:hypothetical protein
VCSSDLRRTLAGIEGYNYKDQQRIMKSGRCFTGRLDIRLKDKRR